jgi:predicted ATP-binding protein involved in virulence
MLKKIKIEGLFNKFNYDIELKEEGITILTGPNGYGKTTILKMAHIVFQGHKIYVAVN